VTDHTPPELSTERRICGKTRAKILKTACRYCTHRDRLAPKGFETCELFGRRYPQCMSDGRAFRFDPDHDEIDILMRRAA
jgi:hypothetical protein